jgi:hypothetical protein
MAVNRRNLMRRMRGTVVVSTIAPFFTAAPTLSATPVVDMPVTFSPGTYGGTSPTVSTRFYLDGVAVGSVNDATFTPSAADEGAVLQIRVDLSNAAGAIFAISTGVAVVGTPAEAGFGATEDDGSNDIPAEAATYSAATTYLPGDMVTYSGSQYYRVANDTQRGDTGFGTTGVPPTDATFWVLITTVRYIDAVDGLDSNNGTSQALAWQTVQGSTMAQQMNTGIGGPGVLARGAVFLFRRGQTHVAQIQANPGGTTATQGYFFGSYGTGTLPKILRNATFAPYTISQGPFWSNRSQMVIRHLNLDGNHAAAPFAKFGCSFSGQNCVIRDSRVENTGSTGIQGFNSQAGQLYIKNNFVYLCGKAVSGVGGGMGIGGGGPGFLVENNTCTYNGHSSTLDHNIYMTAWGAGGTIRANECAYGSNMGINIGINTVVGGVSTYEATDPLFEGNYLHHNHNGLDLGTSNNTRPEVWRGQVRVKNNVIAFNGIPTNTQGHAIYTLNCCESALLENNLIYGNRGDGITVDRSSNLVDAVCKTRNVVIRHNTIVVGGNGSSASQAIRFVDNFANSVDFDGHEIFNNVIVGKTTNDNCIKVDSNTLTSGFTTGANLVYNAVVGSGGDLYYWGALTDTTLAEMQAGGWETGSVFGDPLFTNEATYDFTLQGASPALGLGDALGLTVDIDGNPRSLTTPTAGCYES